MSTAAGILVIGEYAGLLGAFCAGLGIGFLARRQLLYTGKLEMFDDLLGRAVTLLEEAATFLPRDIELEREITAFIRIARQEREGANNG